MKKTPLHHEARFLIAVENIGKQLIKKFKFGYHEVEDMKQQIMVLAIEGLKKYDKSRPLENFLWTHVHHRLFNFKRNQYQRPNPPCLTCPLFKKDTKECSKYRNKDDCDLFRNWSKINNAKKNLMNLQIMEDQTSYIDQKENLEDEAEKNEISRICNEHLTGEMRTLYLKVKSGIKISKSDNLKLADTIRKLLGAKNE